MLFTVGGVDQSSISDNDVDKTVTCKLLHETVNVYFSS